MFKHVFLILAAICSVTAHAETSEELLISINKRVPVQKIEAAKRALERRDLTMGACYFESRVISYFPYASQADASLPYYGVAIVRITQNCAETSYRSYLSWLSNQQRAGVYTLYSNSRIDPFPSMSGRN